jgi:hypothetical protein
MRCTSPCVLCGYLIAYIMIGSVVVNKRSLRTTAPMMGMAASWRCPECGTHIQNTGTWPRTPYVLDAESLAKVAAIRKRRWGIDEAAVPVERAS